MKIILLTNEYPPYIYGGAGVHIEHIADGLSRIPNEGHTIDVFCFGDQRYVSGNRTVVGIQSECVSETPVMRHRRLVDTLCRNILMTGAVSDADIVHCHTWYTLLAGCLIKQIYGIPLIITAHSLEPHRPWKAEQLGASYRASTWIEKTAYENADGIIAVSRSMQKEISALYHIPPEKVHMIYNGIDTGLYKPTFNPSLIESYGVNPHKPYVLFVGRVTRQKGMGHLVRAARYLQGIQIVLCAASPDTEEIAEETRNSIEEARLASRSDIIWIQKFVPREDLIVLYSHAAVFVCPSIYEPFGIISLESMACGTPVVASRVGGIPEVVVHEETGLLVSFEPSDDGSHEPGDPPQFAQDIAAAVQDILHSDERRALMGIRARERVEQRFSWDHVVRETAAFYRSVIQRTEHECQRGSACAAG